MKLSVQSYSLRDLPVDEALQTIADLGVTYVEPCYSPAVLAGITDWHELIPIAWGVPPITSRDEDNGKLVQIALTHGIHHVAVDLSQGDSSALWRLVDHFNVWFGIHPHGPGHPFPGWKCVEEILAFHAGRKRTIGLCLDTGHIHRAGEDNFEAVEKLGQWIRMVHLKDLDAKGKDVPLGEGVLMIRELLWQLRHKAWPDCIISIEYEGEGEPVAALKQSIAVARATGAFSA